MLSGFNTNVQHRGLLLHVQTEDSGRKHPHIITHLFHGGTILASEKSSYADHLASADLAAEVRKLMESQHRAMLERLRSGQLDARLEERLGGEAPATDANAVTAAGEAPLREVRESADAAPAEGGAGAASADERRLDEVVLDYLVERARKRRRHPS